MKRYYDNQKKRLIYINESATPDFWDKHWNVDNFRDKIKGEKNNRFILKTLKKYFPDKKGRILEGGCGMGQYVYCMQYNGYQCVGVDFAKETIKKVKEAFPEIEVKVGDVKNLQFAESYFEGYWSLGVIEHFWDGYYDILKEMRRVINNDGYVFVTVPYLSPLRRLKTKLGYYEEFEKESSDDFYQFVLDPQTVIHDFEAYGFKLMEKKSIDGLKGFKDEISLFRPISQKLYDYQGKNLYIRGFRFVLNEFLSIFAGHMIFLIFQNRK